MSIDLEAIKARKRWGDYEVLTGADEHGAKHRYIGFVDRTDEVLALVAEVERLRAERDRAVERADRLAKGIQQHREDHRRAIGRETKTRHEMNYRKRDANERLWALLDADGEPERRPWADCGGGTCEDVRGVMCDGCIERADGEPTDQQDPTGKE